MALKGDLSTIGLAEVFQMISMSQKEGTLVVQDAESRKSIYFSSSGVQLLSSGKRKGLRLGEMLVRAGKISDVSLNDALENAKIQKKLMGEILVESGIVTDKDIQDLLRAQVEEEIYDLFVWKKAAFEFIEGAPSEDLRDREAHVTKLSFDVNGLLLEAVRRADEWEIIGRKIPSFDAVCVFTSGDGRGEEERTSVEQARRVLRLIDGRNSVNDFVEGTGISKFDICKILLDLIDRGLVRILTVEETMALASRFMAEGRRDKAIKLHHAAAAQAPDDPSVSAGTAKFLEREGLSKEASAQHVRAGRLYLAKGDLDRALRHLQKADELTPDNGEIKFGQFEVYAAAGDLEQGKKLGKELIVQAMMAPDYPRARGLCDRLVAADPEDLEFRVLRAKVLHRTRQQKELEEDMAFLRGHMPADPEEATKIQRELAEISGPPAEAVRTATPAAPPRKKGRRALVGVSVLVVLLAGLGFYVKYEMEARKALDEALAGSRSMMERQSFVEAKKIVDGFLEGNYRLSPFQANRAKQYLEELDAEFGKWQLEKKEREEAALRNALEGMKNLEASIESEKDRNPSRALQLAEQLRATAEQNKSGDFYKRAVELSRQLGQYLKDATELKTKADRLEEEGKLKEAALLVDKLLAGFPNTDAAHGAFYPLGIRTRPAGVKVKSMKTGMEVGVTSEAPLRHAMKGGEAVRLLFEKRGYVSVERDVRDKTMGEIFVELTEKVESWVMPLGVAISGEPLLLGDTLYVAASSRLYALSVEPKGLRWSEPVDSQIEGSPCAGNGLLYVGTAGGWIYALDPAKEKREAWKHPAGAGLRGTPVLSSDGSVLYAVSSDRVLHAVTSRAGVALWKRELPAASLVAPVFAAGMLVVACEEGTLLALKGPDPREEVWKIRMDGSLGPMLPVEGAIHAVCSDGNVYTLDAATGKVVWKRPVPGGAQGRLVRVGNLVFVAARDGKLHWLDASSGGAIGFYEVQGGHPTGLAASGTLVFFGGDNESFYALDAAQGELRWRLKCKRKVRGPAVGGGKNIYFASEDSLYSVELD